MQLNDRARLTRVGAAFLALWFVGDIVVGVAVWEKQALAQREASDLHRSKENRRRFGNYASYHGGEPKHGLVGLTLFHGSTRLPLRCVGVVGLVFLVAFGPVVAWIRQLRRFYKNNPRAQFATILLLVSGSLYLTVEMIASRNSHTVMVPRKFTATEIEQDRRERTLVNPPVHLNPSSTGELRSITSGSDRSAVILVAQVSESVRDYLDLIQVVAGVVGGVGVFYLFLSSVGWMDDSRSPEATPDASDD